MGGIREFYCACLIVSLVLALLLNTYSQLTLLRIICLVILSCDRMIRLHAHPFPPVSKLSLFLSLPVCRQSSLLPGEGGDRGGREAES
jgi:hypothetical protein